MSMNEARVYRHVPWLFAAGLIVAALTGAVGAGLVTLLHELSVATVCKAAVALLFYVVVVAFPLLSFRWRTVIDDEAVTQHWITRTYRIPLAEITGLERDAAAHRWFLRIHAGEKTFEVIPCPVYRRPGGAFGATPPRTLLAAEADLEARLNHHQPA
ncbi:hypothetical protein [Actinoplanes awajinensis]|uniref:PH domain-containing protein n=1 Tax=Actinoplanes awajinensis subsp. mycoplanecinus TaxID=135947 RepID=A0A0X3UYI5_9ACTN|nr:hypothetical protein [Actinoplanes awajinensis]KUL37575.1 hypothetical protein ADL15_11135 [Actinoplanes awajinensis subsp. mycoplanecinus]